MRKLIFLILLLAGCVEYSQAITGDSLHILTTRDTIVLEMGNYGEKVFRHTLAKGQTLYSVARFYGMRLEDVYFYNPHLQTGYHPSQEVLIPIPNRAIRRYRNANYCPDEWVPLLYQVKNGDTFYGITKRYFNLSVDTLYARNNLHKNPKLNPKQLLHVGYMSVYGIPDSIRTLQTNPLWRQSSQLRNQFVGKSYRNNANQENGAAFWDVSKNNSKKLYALHNKAPLGSVIAITNPMYKRTVYVKVIGRIPDRAHDADVKVVLSPAVAKMLKAIDPKFYVSIRYFNR